MTTPTSSWQWLGQRPAPPLVLAGPIVRRVDPLGASVWVATRSSCAAVKLEVFGTADTSSTPVATQTGKTTRLGDNLHVALVTARPPTTAPFQSGVVYRYRLTFGTTSFADALGPVTPLSDICYPDGTATPLPSFVLPPHDLAHVKFVHASCRKAHGENLDALPVLDDQLLLARTTSATDGAFALNRPQQLFLTGDQIYADDLADAWLAMVIDVAGWLMGTRKEPRPALFGPKRDGSDNPFTWDDAAFVFPFWGDTPVSSSAFVPWPAEAGTPWPVQGSGAANAWPAVGGWRGRLVQAAGFTSDPPEKEAEKYHPPAQLDGATSAMTKMTAKNHLLLLGEFYASFVLAWSPVLWCFPAAAAAGSVPLTPPSPWDGDADTIANFGARTRAVRRALANIATYMICDDHEVTDDWFMNRLWCERVLSDPGDTVGRRVVRNALIAYAVFEGWGNTPEQFEGSTTNGNSLLTLLDSAGEMDFSASGGAASVANLVGMPAPLTHDSCRLSRPPNALTWRWRWAPQDWSLTPPQTWPYEVIALDCRTARKYDTGELDAPQLLDDGQRPGRPYDPTLDEFTIQLGPAPPSGMLSIVIAQTPVFGVRVIEAFQESHDLFTVFDKDAEAWGLSRTGFQLMMSRLAARNQLTVLLSGDVHYSFVSVCDYWATTFAWGDQQALPASRAARIVQLNSSALKNEIFKTRRLLHNAGAAAQHVGSKNPQAWVGFATPAQIAPGPLPSSGYVPIDVNYYDPAGLNHPPVIIDRDDYYRVFAPVGNATTLPSPDWMYRIQFLSGAGAVAPSVPLPTVDSLPTGILDKIGVVSAWNATLRAWHRVWNGSTVVGVNNLSTVTFTAPDANGVPHVRQEIAWRPPDLAHAYPVPTTTFDVALQVQPKPAPPTTP